MESLQPKMVEKNSRMREIQKELLDIGAQQREVASEKQQHEDVIRCVCLCACVCVYSCMCM